ncbi:MAG: restriction endonuclease [Chloroflexi bacterium]|nr:restriction endonuclease [Chloroflexota bacterium]
MADSQASPEEVLESTFDSIGQSVESDLLERVKAAPPIFFEQLVVDLLVAMGYGGSTPVKRASRRVGRSGDEGIYGIIDEARHPDLRTALCRPIEPSRGHETGRRPLACSALKAPRSHP